MKELALELNEGASVVNLADHTDLLAEIEAGSLTEKRALEIAAQRDADALRETKATARRERETAESQTKANVRRGVALLDEFERTINAVDPNYATLRPSFIQVLRPALKRAHPSEWGQVAREIYDQIKTMRPATSGAKPKPKNQPLRPKGSGGGGGGGGKTTEASSALEALDSALEDM